MLIFEAVERDDVGAVERLLREAPEGVHAQQEFTGTPLHRARSAGMVRLLLRYGADVHARGWLGATPLHEASARGDLAPAEALLEAGADPHRVTEAGQTPLHRAATAELVTALVVAGANVDARETSGQTPLHRAAQHGRDGALRTLLRLGAAVDARNDWGQTPLHWAAQEGREGAVRALLAAGAAVDPVAQAFGNTPLHAAAFRGQTRVVELLLARGADPNLRNGAGQLPYHLAKSNGWSELAARLRGHTTPEALGLSGVQRGPLRKAAFQALCLHPDGARAITIVAEGRLACWSLAPEPRVTHWIQTEHADLRDVAVSPLDGSVALAAEAALELRRWDDLETERRLALPGEPGASALAFSQDGRFLAVADRGERLHLLEVASGAVRATVEAPEWVGCLRFSPDGTLLASACSWQGGGNVLLHRVGSDGSLQLLHTYMRCTVHTPAAEYVDELLHLAFTPDGGGVVLFETTEDASGKPAGWIGNGVMLDTRAGTVRWTRSIAGELTGNRRPSRATREPGAFRTQVAVVGQEVFCGARRGRVVVLLAETGEWQRTVQVAPKADVIGLAADPRQETLWALTRSALVGVATGMVPEAR